ncbi:ankyrin repeat domain-containing protein [Rhodopirellula sp. SWK7]|uniref:ankyrin repeat domain-containing protein n=1 Tax=Rhodopirellula sp. SWK7 TaxID=595460 RepID=UPI00191C4C57|nr:ankyrin repeat domain-containing protein [Rhodopirellula sp. SWK7]
MMVVKIGKQRHRLFPTYCLLLLTLSVGCFDDGVRLKIPGVKRTFHEAVGWKAEDFFNDSAVVELCNAIEANDIATMKRLIAEGVDVNAIGEGGVTPLLWAFVDNQPERFQLLLENGADPNVKTTTRLNAPNAFAVGDSVTTLAASSYFVGPYEAVLQHGGDPSIVGPHKQPMLHVIVAAPISQELKKKRILMAVEYGADINQKDSKGTIGRTAVAAFQQWELALWLLQQGVDPHYYPPHDDTNMVGSALSHGELITPGRKEAYEKLLQWFREDGYDLEAIQETTRQLREIKVIKSRKRFIQRKIAEQVRQGLRPDPNLDAEAQDEWYAERRRARQRQAE